MCSIIGNCLCWPVNKCLTQKWLVFAGFSKEAVVHILGCSPDNSTIVLGRLETSAFSSLQDLFHQTLIKFPNYSPDKVTEILQNNTDSIMHLRRSVRRQKPNNNESKHFKTWKTKTKQSKHQNAFKVPKEKNFKKAK